MFKKIATITAFSLVIIGMIVLFQIQYAHQAHDTEHEDTHTEIIDFETCGEAGNPVMESYPRQCTHDNHTYTEEIEPIGGGRDEHGCLGPAGYSYDENISACIRVWELDEEQKIAAKAAIDHFGTAYATYIMSVESNNCTGCYTVKISIGEDTQERRTITLIDNTVSTVSMTPEECIEQEGHTVTTTGGAICDAEEANLGEVTGFISPAICCK